MKDPKPDNAQGPDTGAGNAAGDMSAEATPESTTTVKPTTEEQMAQFEEYLKETDCGHRPC